MRDDERVGEERRCLDEKLAEPLAVFHGVLGLMVSLKGFRQRIEQDPITEHFAENKSAFDLTR